MIGVCPSVKGQPAFEVLTISNAPELFLTNQVQPEPKLVIQAAVNSSLNLSKEPKVEVIASAIAPVGSPPPLGLRQFQ